jgi:hypothetical protein
MVFRTRFPSQITERPAIAEPLAGHTIDVEAEQLVAVELGHTDADSRRQGQPATIQLHPQAPGTPNAAPQAG